MVSGADAVTILSGMAYLNIHSPDFPAGAIRGQIDPNPMPGVEASVMLDDCNPVLPDVATTLATTAVERAQLRQLTSQTSPTSP